MADCAWGSNGSCLLEALSWERWGRSAEGAEMFLSCRLARGINTRLGLGRVPRAMRLFQGGSCGSVRAPIAPEATKIIGHLTSGRVLPGDCGDDSALWALGSFGVWSGRLLVTRSQS